MKQTIIVGGGISGLTAAAYIAKSGHKVMLFEKNNEFGGLVGSIKSNDFTFDVGVRALVNAGIILPMLKDLNIKLPKVINKVSIGIENHIIHVESKNDVEKYGNLLIKLYPESKKNIQKFIRQMKKISNYVDIMYQIDNPIYRDLKKDYKFLLTKLLPWLPKFLYTLNKINKLNEPVEKYVAKYIKNKSLCDIITQHFFKATPTFFALGYFAIYPEYFYPQNGVGSLAEVVKEKALEYGAELITNSKIIAVNTAEKYVVDYENKKHKYDDLIWTSDLNTLYSVSQNNDLPEKTIKKIENYKEKLKHTKGSESVFSVYLEVDLPLKFFAKISNGHFFYTPSKKGLGKTHSNELDDLLKNYESKSKSEIISWLNRFLELNTYEISIPGLRNKNLAPDGKSGLIISILTEYKLFEKVKNSGWYDEFINIIEKKIIKILSNSVYSGLENKILNSFSFSPINIKQRVETTDGAIVGWSFEKNVPAVKKMLQINKSVLTPIPRVYQAGQWTYSPAGVPMSILTGKLAADKIIN